MLFDTFAVTGGKPTASSVGKVIRLPEPATALTAPAPMPAAMTASASSPVTGLVLPHARSPRRTGSPGTRSLRTGARRGTHQVDRGTPAALARQEHVGILGHALRGRG